MFTKSDLKPGMVVRTKEGNIYIVFEDFLASKEGYVSMDIYDRNLLSKKGDRFTIDYVYEAKKYSLETILNDSEYSKKVLFNRHENKVKEMTLEEVEEKLGYRVKIITKNE